MKNKTFEQDERSKNTEQIELGMEVEATKGDLGEEDVSKPKVTDVVRNAQGNVEKVIVQKGVVFKKELEVPAERIQVVEHDEGTQNTAHHGRNGSNGSNASNGKVIIDAQKAETEALNATGAETLPTEAQMHQQEENDDLLEEVQEAIPTVEGLRQMEAKPEQEQEEPAPSLLPIWLRMFGPGFLGGMAGNDSSAVAAYSIDGVQNGFSHLWLLLLATPLYQSVMFTCAKLGRVTKKGLAEVVREHYGRWPAVLASLILIIANVALIAADLVAIGSGIQLLTGISWLWFIVPVALLLWYLTVYTNFDAIKKIFIVMSLVFVAYIVTAILAKPNWQSVVFNTFVPHIDLSFASISSAVALLGATISPYNIFWQVQGEKEEKRPGTMKQQLRLATLDLGTGVVSGNFIAYFIIVSTAATLFTHHKTITTAADAAQALVPILGPFAEYLFAIGIIGAGLVAIPVLLAGTSYAVAGTFGWPAGLSKKPWQNEGFYLMLTVALVISLALALLRIDPITLLFWANVLSGVLSPILVVYLLLIGNNRKIMQNQRLGFWTNIGLVLTFCVMTSAAFLLFYGLATGHGS